MTEPTWLYRASQVNKCKHCGSNLMRKLKDADGPWECVECKKAEPEANGPQTILP